MGMLENLNSQYPCSQRIGYGRECNCKNKQGPINESYVECGIYGNTKGSTCTDCNFQYQEQLRSKKS